MANRCTCETYSVEMGDATGFIAMGLDTKPFLGCQFHCVYRTPWRTLLEPPPPVAQWRTKTMTSPL